jgi:TonB family protein
MTTPVADRILSRGFARARATALKILFLLAVGSPLALPVWGRTPRAARHAAGGPRAAETRLGVLPTREGLRLQLVTDLGNVRILSRGAGSVKDPQVTYKVELGTDSREPNAQESLKQFVFTARPRPDGVQLTGRMVGRAAAFAVPQPGRLWVNIEVTIPRRYNLEVTTRAGNIETQDLEGRASLMTYGGNITAGNVGGPEAAGAQLETQGGHISVRRVNGDLRATTAGGHISVGNVQGDAVLHTAGGHIRAGTIRGTAALETGGGNIFVQRSGANVTATTEGGQIDLGEAGGAIRARTGGGGIRIQHVVAPTELETGGGSILLTQVQAAVRASTGAGTITAWFTSGGKRVGASQLESGQGDIVVYLPKELPVTIDATIEPAGEHRIEADPTLPLQVTYLNSGPGGRAVRGKCAVNGGGEVLRLKTSSGNILLKLADSDTKVLVPQHQMEHLQRRLEMQQKRLLEQLQQAENGLQESVEQQQKRIEEITRESNRIQEWARRFEEFWLGGIRVDAEAQQQKLIQQVRPVYPDVARQAGIEGTVGLRATIRKDGTVQDVRVLSGHPLLAQAAAQAIRRWRYQPTLLDGKPVNVVTTVTVVFRLH